MAPLGRSIRSSAYAIAALGSLLLTSGCAPQEILDNAVEQAVEQETGVDVELGGSLPADWPQDVPVIEGNIFAAAKLGSGAESTWTAQIETDDVAVSYEAVKASLSDAGYELVFDYSSGGIYGGSFDNGTYSVTVASTEDSGQNYITYVVIASPGS